MGNQQTVSLRAAINLNPGARPRNDIAFALPAGSVINVNSTLDIWHYTENNIVDEIVNDPTIP